MSRPEDAHYHPCQHGVHVCGANHDDNYFFTQANYPDVTFESFCRAKVVCEDETQPKDFVVDFVEGGSVIEDFWISRQMLNRLKTELSN